MSADFLHLSIKFRIMKTLPFILVLFLSASTYGKNIPGPFWYSLSEKILTETHQFLGMDDAPSKPVARMKAKKPQLITAPLKCQPKKATLLPNLYPVKNKTIQTGEVD